MKGISEIIATILMLMITIALAGTAYVLISSTFTQKTRTVVLLDAFCSGTTANVVIRNDGSDTIRVAEQTFVSIDEACTEPSKVDLPPGVSTIYQFTACSTNKIHIYRLIGPANAIPITFRCA